MKKTLNRAVFILAAGAGNRWHRDGIWPAEQPKQLLRLGGETIIGRTVNMVRNHGYEPVVVTHNKVIADALPGVDILNPSGRHWLIETLKSTMPRWTEINTVLWSDVVYSPSVLDAMLTDESSIKFYGKWGDGFGLVWRKDNPRIRAGIDAVLQDAKEQEGVIDFHSVGRSWELYRWFMGWPLHEHQGTDESSAIFERVPDDDYSCDIDTPENWARVQNDFVEWLGV